MAILRCRAPDDRLLVLDGLRLNRVQRQMWAQVCGTPLQSYVADPAIGSVHGFGLAVDLTLADHGGGERDMDTPFDAFDPLAEPRLDAHHPAAGLLGDASSPVARSFGRS